MFKKFCGKVGRMCHCDDEEANTEDPSQSNRPRQSTHQNQGNGQRQAIPQNVGPQGNGEGQVNQENEQTVENEQTEDNEQTEENEEGENDPPLPPSRTSSNTSSTGLMHAMNEANLSERGPNNQADPMDEDNGSKGKRRRLQEEEDPEYVEGQQGSSSHRRGSGLSRPSKRARSNPPSPVHRSPSPIASSGRDQVPYWSWSPGTSHEGSPRPKAPQPDSPWPAPQPEALQPEAPAPRKPTKEKIAKYRELGANFQAWIDDPNKPDCPIGRSWLTLDELENDPTNYKEIWHKEYDMTADNPVELQGGDASSTNIPRGEDQYRYTSLRRFHVYVDQPKKENAWSSHEHLIGRGIIIGKSIWRKGGQHWNVIAQALYTNDYRIDTLRHVMFTNVINDELAPYIEEVLYPRKGTLWSEAGEVPCKKILHGSVEYQELLGTKLGKGVAALILAAFTRGTVRITQIVVWSYNGSAQIRFEIEPNPPDPITLPAVAALGSI
ncbi:hypothetical protein N7467_000688 [Penicillium canescens]|nr:hypothetical protein N7467_000688 [Penicillium canescens]